jgi:hypothetical protein
MALRLFDCIDPLPFEDDCESGGEPSEGKSSRWVEPTKARCSGKPKPPERVPTLRCDCPENTTTLNNFYRLKQDSENSDVDSPRVPRRKLSAICDHQPRLPMRLTSNARKAGFIGEHHIHHSKALKRTISVVIPSSLRWSCIGVKVQRSVSCQSN